MIPDNLINARIKTLAHNMVVDSKTFPVFVSRATTSRSKNYILINTQLNQPEFNKCGDGWENSTEIQIIVILDTNAGSKVLLNNATNELISRLENFTLSTVTVNKNHLSVVNEITENRKGQVIYTKVMRLETSIR